jgi:type IV pilus biogenesis protein CpaD/CtpE
MKNTPLLALLLALPACSEIPAQAYFNRGNPENLIDGSSEVVTMKLSSTTALNELASMVAQDPPTRVELNCAANDGLCMEARQLFDQYAVPVDVNAGPQGITMIYERVVARDCENRYIDNSINPYNLHHPTFGCSISANMVQMVSDKRQFTNPNLMDYADGEKAYQVYRVYLRTPESPEHQSGSLLSTVQN